MKPNAGQIWNNPYIVSLHFEHKTYIVSIYFEHKTSIVSLHFEPSLQRSYQFPHSNIVLVQAIIYKLKQKMVKDMQNCMAVIEISVCYYLRQKSSGTVKSFSIRCSKFPNMNVSRKEMRRVGKTPENYRGRKYTKEKKKCLKYECIVVKLLVMQCLTLFACNINGCF